MLILERRPLEAIRIGDDITLEVLGVKAGQVRSSILCPRNIAIHRDEVFRQHAREGTTPTMDTGNASEELSRLILTRAPGQGIKIGVFITVLILSIKGYIVRIGVDAPRAIAVHRLEIYERIKRQQAQA